MRAAVYARLSKRTDANAPNLDDQLKRCREHADKRGWTIVAEHTDYGESAFDRDDPGERPAYADLLTDVKASRVDVILAWRPDRLWRDPIECALLMRDCVRNGVQLVATVTEGDRDPANPGDEMVSTIVAAVGRYESASKSDRSRAKQRQLAELGKPSGGGLIPYGYTRDREIVEAEADIIRSVTDAIIAGATIRSQCRVLATRGIKTKTGRQWTTSNLYRLLRSPHIAGLRHHKGRIVGVATWPGVLTEERWSLLQDALDVGRTHWAPGRDYMLTRGLAVCGLCSAPLIARARQGGARAYACAAGIGYHGCGKIGRLADPLEADVERRFLDELDVLALNSTDVPETDVVTVDDVNAAELALTNLARDHYVLKVIARNEYMAARVPLAAEAERLRQVLRAAAGPKVLAVDEVREAWAFLTLAERREAMRPYVDRVVLLPAVRGRKTYDPARVKVFFTK